MPIKMIQSCAMNSQSIKDISRTFIFQMGRVFYELFRNIYIQLGTLFIPLCLKSHERYYFNMLRMIKLLYHMYIEHEIYHIVYNKVQNCLNEYQFIEGTMSEWDGYITFSNILRNKVY